MFLQACVFVLLESIIGSAWSADRYSHCSSYTEYNTLVNLIKHDDCMNIDSVFKLLAGITNKEHTGTCRIHVINRLSDHFGAHAISPISCSCHGVNKLQQYHQGSGDSTSIFSTYFQQYYHGHGDGSSDLRAQCVSRDSNYRDLYNQFFESNHHNDIPACRTHHSLWYTLNHIDTKSLAVANSCQKDIIFHLNYAFDHHADKCSCSSQTISNRTNVHEPDVCHQLSSFKKLLQLGDTDGCLSANSVWHYLDDLQVENPHCRRRIQRHMAEKYNGATSQDNDGCVCRERKPLVNHQIHRMDNGSFLQCKRQSGQYHYITTDLFANITSVGCQNHNYLWSRLQGIHDYCSSHHHNDCTHYVDCTQDLIVRAAVQYPTGASDNCVCSKITTTTMRTTQTTSTTTNTSPPTSATPTSETQATTKTQQPLAPPNNYSCNKQAVIENVAMSLHTTHPNASPCDQQADGFDNAYVLSACNTSSPGTWRAGANVMANCRSKTHLISPFTPISTFSSGRYVSDGAQSGIFLECYNNLIKMAVQKCNGFPEIVHIDTGVLVNNQRDFYVIV